jgi:hypothetical protein
VPLPRGPGRSQIVVDGSWERAGAFTPATRFGDDEPKLGESEELLLHSQAGSPGSTGFADLQIPVKHERAHQGP